MPQQVPTREEMSQLGWLLQGPGEISSIGAETGTPVRDGIALYVSSHGSYRYVYYIDKVPVSGLQVVSRSKKKTNGKLALATIANVWTYPTYRRQGYAHTLLQKAREDFRKVVPVRCYL